MTCLFRSEQVECTVAITFERKALRLPHMTEFREALF
ncbi:hypothetical protein SAMN05216456_0188 [Devosia crocina]|uniref:Uncharacterized protein n=1 Tax=Devosia crocina TaxID=429728 RepID=A0A1I7MXF8_9HYPH|nr:hypothetical protein SAMN05216456_0188 [Devosia crocina]